MDPIGRKFLPHEPPLGIGTGGQLFFITICVAERIDRPLTRKGVPELLIEAARHRHERGVWYVRLFLVMPDHVHALIRVPYDGVSAASGKRLETLDSDERGILLAARFLRPSIAG